MVDAVSGDNGKGGTSDGNNREYGGSVMPDGSVVPGEAGEVTTPGGKNPTYGGYQEGDKTRFHSHPSGTIEEKEILLDDFGGQPTYNISTKGYE